MPKPASLSVGLRLLLASQAMAPLSVKLGLVQQLGAEKAALLAPHMPPGQLRELIMAMPIEFAAAVTVHLDPRLILDTYLSLPDSLHLEVARQLCADGAFATAARYAECLSAKQIKVLIYGINDVDHVLQIARHIVDMPLISESLRSFSTGYLCKLTEAAVADRNLPVAAQVLGGLSLARQADVCAGLQPSTLRQLLPLLLLISGEGLRKQLPEAVLELFEQQLA
ncbi:hypothetical protein DBR00_03085 [Pseudomonas sp. HMWF032]|uniref:hypothetical protein n=1 Tax=Pseudomonas sp. HMWF032 TaxID=2056866 RepID=UPI000D36A1B3|nr:hypothetical protein [Pseudomonas sp. HMWF032]PTS84799.1 hypothetical protein DBR00_03085 [Pseudomonas sp. HMWF032]PTT85030.1 hypothetical protein DBR41_05515 [Pseudomonas sp. HMWF010]